MNRKGRLIVVDGIDGVGKGVFLATFVEEAEKQRKRVLDIDAYWKAYNFHPSMEELQSHFDVIVTSEPTYEGLGRYIREEMIAKNGRTYSAIATAEAYALNRAILYEMLILPALGAGVDVFQSRSVSTSIVYQTQQSKDEIDDATRTSKRPIYLDPTAIMNISGNKFCLEHPMDFLVIPTIEDVEDAQHRASLREKNDNCRFENLDFQLKIKEVYESAWFRELFERLGVKVVYMDAGKSIEHSQQQARDFYHAYLR